LSNLEADVSRAESLQTGEAATPYTDLLKAILAAPKKAAPYLANLDGSLVTIRIALFSGDHFVISKNLDYSTGNALFKLMIY
jgi:hypothetical protein